MQTALITGASRGIGAAIARKLASMGYRLALICEKNIDMLDDLADELTESYDVEVLTFCCDVSDGETVDETCEEIIRAFGTPDVLVNNAGIAHIGLLQDMSALEWERIIGVNLSSCFYMAHGILPGMIRRGSGHIINISSMWGVSGASCEVAYSAAKGGVNAFTKALAKEVAPAGIAVNAIACGVIDTEMNRGLTEEDRADLVDSIPEGRFGTPEDIAQAVGMILGSTYMTGQVIGVDGGFL